MNYQATKTHEEPQMHTVSQRSQPEKAAHCGQDSSYTAFWKRQNCADTSAKRQDIGRGCRGNKDEQVAQRGFLGQWNYSAGCCNGAYKASHIC